MTASSNCISINVASRDVVNFVQRNSTSLFDYIDMSVAESLIIYLAAVRVESD